MNIASSSVTLRVILVIAVSTTLAADDRAPTDRVRVAAVQINGYDKGDLPEPKRKPSTAIVNYIHRAGKEEVQLVVFPEYVLGHIQVPGPETEMIGAAAKMAGLYVIVGCWENHRDGSYANTALIFDRQGNIAGKYHKTHAAVDHFEGTPAWSKPPSGKSRQWFLEHDPEWTMQKGTDLPVFDFDFGKVGIMTCYDGWFPEPARVLSLKGAEVIVWMNGRRGRVEDFIVKSTMFQSHGAMITTNQAYGGGTMIGDGTVRILQASPDRQESYISATLNLKQIRARRTNSRNFQQRRPDLYHPLVAPLSTPTRAQPGS